MTRRAVQPLNRAARRAANAAVRNMTDPPGRPLDPTAPGDAAARRAWMDAYEAAGGPIARPRRSQSVDRPVAECVRQNWVELRYLHCDGTPVVGAAYVVSGDGFSASGVLDDAGFARIEGVPEAVSSVSFEFHDDPEEYSPSGPTISSRIAAVGEAALEVFESVLDWVWGTVQGDFNQDASLSQTAVNTILGLIPIVDQVLDVRDVIAGLKHLIEYYMETEEEQAAHEGSLGLSYETWLWIGLFLIVIGLIPTVGSAVKGVLKMLIRALQDAGSVAGRLSAAQLRRIWEQLVAVLNHLGVRPGNAHRWLSELPGRLPALLDDAAQRIRNAARVFNEFLDAVAQRTRQMADWGIVDQAWARRSLDEIARVRRALAHAMSRLDAKKAEINNWLQEQLNAVLGASGRRGGTGSVNTSPPDLPEPGVQPARGANQDVQPERPPSEPDLPPRGRRRPRRRPPSDEELQRARDMRTELGSTGNRRVRRKIENGQGNVAFADYNIDGNSGTANAFSGRDAIDGYVPYVPNDQRLLPATEAGAAGHLRDVDGEAKMLENLYRNTDESSTGTVTMFTERDACSSCEGVIEQFMEERPGIEVILVENGGVVE